MALLTCALEIGGLDSTLIKVGAIDRRTDEGCAQKVRATEIATLHVGAIEAAARQICANKVGVNEGSGKIRAGEIRIAEIEAPEVELLVVEVPLAFGVAPKHRIPDCLRRIVHAF